jgi:phosphoglycerol transferase MdoB-like AlkP superfamily enzyme
MVEEGVTWFSQGAPRQPRMLALVLPPLAWMLAPVPFLVALLGSIAVRRGRGGALFMDAVWCGTALFCKPLLFVHEARLEPSLAAYGLRAITAAALPVAALLLPRRIRVWTLTATAILGSAIVLGDILYYWFFGDVLSVADILAVRQTGHVWGTIRSLLSPVLIWTVLDWPAGIWLAIGLSRSRAPGPAFRQRLARAGLMTGSLACGAMVLAAAPAFDALSLDQMFRDRAIVEQLGLYGFHMFDAWNYGRTTWVRPHPTQDQIRDAARWFRERASMRSGPGSIAFGAARGCNLIVIQVESLQEFAVDLRIDGQDVMPRLKQWPADALRYSKVTDQTNQGRTSDAEFTSLTSLLPLDHGAVAFQYPANHFTALPAVLAENGYATVSAVPFEPGFWNRRLTHSSYGFQRSLFESDFDITEQIGWGLNDHDFLQQMVPRLEQMPRPFAAWLITLSLHHPYEDFPDRHKVLNLGALEGTSLGNYLHTMRFFDTALDAFVQSLRDKGLLDSSVLVVFGDHDAGFAGDAAVARAIGIDGSDRAWMKHDRVPLFIRIPASAGPSLNGTRRTPAGQADLAPTVLSLLGIDAAPLPYVGRNLLAPSIDVPVLRPYGEWIDAEHFALTQGSTVLCHDATGHLLDFRQCAASDASARRERDVSRLVVTADLQATVRDLLGGDADH